MHFAARRRFSCLVAALAAAACSDSATGPAGGLAVTTEVAPTTFRAGDRVAITLTVRNSGSRTRSIAPTYCEDPFTVTASDGTVLPPVSTRYCALVLVPPREIPPGEVAVLTYEWRGDVGPGSTNGLGSPITPGTYTLQGSVRTADRTAVVTGTPVTIQVLAR